MQVLRRKRERGVEDNPSKSVHLAIHLALQPVSVKLLRSKAPVQAPEGADPSSRRAFLNLQSAIQGSQRMPILPWTGLLSDSRGYQIRH